MDRAALVSALEAAAAETVKLREVSVTGWPFPIYMRPMTVAESDVLEAIEEGDAARTARILARVMRDEKGVLLFDEKNPDDLALLGKQNVSVWNAVMRSEDAKKGSAPTENS